MAKKKKNQQLTNSKRIPSAKRRISSSLSAAKEEESIETCPTRTQETEICTTGLSRLSEENEVDSCVLEKADAPPLSPTFTSTASTESTEAPSSSRSTSVHQYTSTSRQSGSTLESGVSSSPLSSSYSKSQCATSIPGGSSANSHPYSTVNYRKQTSMKSTNSSESAYHQPSNQNSPPITVKPVHADSQAPLQICLPISLSYGKIVVPYSVELPDFPPHHYIFGSSFPSANRLFCRSQGLCNQNPAWLMVDVAYLGCKEHQVPVVAALFNDAFADLPTFSCPLQFRCSGLRPRKECGAGWFLYESKVEICTQGDMQKLKAIMDRVVQLTHYLRDNRLCQAIYVKPTVADCAVVVLKQEGAGIPSHQLAECSTLVCEGIQSGEVRLVRQKPPDRSCVYELDPRFPEEERIMSRPIASDPHGNPARKIFASVHLPRIIQKGGSCSTCYDEASSSSSVDDDGTFSGSASLGR